MSRPVKPLIIPKSKKVRGLGLTAYCRMCDTGIGEVCKETGKPLQHCPHPERHVFKCFIKVPGTKNQRRIKILETRDLDEAIKQAIEFKQQIRSEGARGKMEEYPETRIKPGSKPIPTILINAMARHISWLTGEDVPEQIQRPRSKKHLKDIEHAYMTLVACLKAKGYNIEQLKISEVNDDIVGVVFRFLKDKQFAPATFNRYFVHYKSLINWYREEYDQPIRNPFKKVIRQEVVPDPQSISKETYEELLKKISLEDGFRQYEDGYQTKRNFYRPWLANGIRLGLETGRRLEEISSLKWNMFDAKDGNQVIEVEDLKVNRIKNNASRGKKKLIYIPVTKSLQELLHELGYNKYYGTDEYILAPEVKSSRDKIIPNVLSRGFTHYYEQLKTGKHLTFKCLRKTYITSLKIASGGGDIKAITGHSSDKVLDHYVVDRDLAKWAARTHEVFPERSKRDEEIENVRQKTDRINNREIDI